jgi:predicted esterase
MTDMTFEELYTRLQDYFRDGEYAGALDLATAGRERFPERQTVLDYWRFTLLARSGDLDGALETLSRALEAGSWYSELLLRRSPSLQPLQDDPRFEVLIAKNQIVAEQDQKNQFPFYILRSQGKCQTGGPACPLLIGLHTNGGTAQTSLDFWKPAAALGWLVAAPQSSQALMKGAYVWDDRPIAEREIQKDYDLLRENYSINPWQTVLAGHSLGGETAIGLALKGMLGINYFLVIGPAGPLIDNPEELDALIKEGQRSGVRGYIIAGEMDNLIAIDRVSELVETLNQAGIETELEVVAGAEHEFEPSYEEAILRGLNFLTS